ncbi:MAG: P-II family nitrogen regulator [SAR202 cluster bacterium]|nr:P-II family nitrogen regulator [SAR202 cluster bacterium]|tara:strand:- start:976 stop:1329 length:354 start_codon:yes stop_codon:yes gene_type:complete
MIKIEIIVRPERIGGVTEALDASGCTGYYYANITGQGRQGGVEVITGRGGQTTTKSAVPKTLITTVVDESIVDKVIDAVIEAARSPNGGNIGDGKIFVSPVTDVIRVSSGERGEIAM